MANYDSTTTRRSVIAGAAAAIPAAAFGAQPAQTAGGALEEMLARYRALQAAYNAMEGDVMEDGENSDAYKQLAALQKDIFRAPAGTVRGLQIKWEIFCETVEADGYPLTQAAFRSMREAIAALPA